MKVITRIAPSPTGKFHIGTARTALFNYLFAKKNNGNFLLRWEDTDKERSTKESENDIREGLKWLGLNWEGKEHFQLENLNIYNKFAKQLLESKEAYEKDKAIWFRVKKDKTIAFQDCVKGKISFNTNEFNDFVIVKSSGIPTFYFANAIDDHEMKVSHVLRGEDHLTNTPKQIMINLALGFKNPIFGHIPLILNEDKSKLSKRKNAVSVSEYKEKGYLPEAIINFLALLGWNPGDEREYFSLNELVKEFSLEKVQKSGAIFNVEKLNSINNYYIKKLDNKVLAEKLGRVSKIAQGTEPKYLEKILVLIKDRLKYLKEFEELATYFYNELKYDPKILIFKKSNKNLTLKGLQITNYKLQATSDKDWKSAEKINEILGKVVVENSLDNGSVFWPTRVALSGLEKSPSPAELLWALGKEESLKRINKALQLLNR